MKILSIDFDYFQCVDIETLCTAYPDPIDLPTFHSTVVWATKYADKKHADRLRSVTINEKELEYVKELIRCQAQDIPVLVSNSHVDIYNILIGELIEQRASDNDCIFITHIDMHDDVACDVPELCCGNWLSYASDEYNAEAECVINPISLEMLEDKSKQKVFTTIHESISKVKDTAYDAVFLCRSDNWLPPHLDKYFDDLLSTLKTRFDTLRVLNDVMQPRDYKDIVNGISREIRKPR